MSEKPFWITKSLQQLDHDEWESLCDGCGICCLVKLEDEQSGEIHVTRAACHLLDIASCRCRDYAHRSQRVSTCVVLKPGDHETFRSLPHTCAYRCLAEGRELPAWHPLLDSQSDDNMPAELILREFAISEEFVHPEQLQDMILFTLKEEGD